jgi:hypothetical protein
MDDTQKAKYTSFSDGYRLFGLAGSIVRNSFRYMLGKHTFENEQGQRRLKRITRRNTQYDIRDMKNEIRHGLKAHKDAEKKIKLEHKYQKQQQQKRNRKF